jgi:pimeloyl-ACP methyl ester carboxylesterase
MTATLDTPRVQVGSAEGTTLTDPDKALVCIKKLPLPGIVIFVHGVNSDGEWFTAAEEGLCKGLNTRLGRHSDQLKYTGPVAGQLTPAKYIEGLTADGYINPEMTSKTYIKPDASFSPVIHFRWGYKANKEELKQYGTNIFLNEQNYWGGGPFANGTSSLPDLWNEGLNDRLFLWITVQHLNSVPSRKVYACPPRGYMVLGALRLAKLIESIRRKQADTPITVVCHSQGNMVGIAAAFLGDRLPDVTDGHGKKGRCVADTYVLCNPPYSLEPKIATDSWAQRGVQDKDGNRGRESYVARAETLKAYFDILRERAALEPDAADLDAEMANTQTSASGGATYNAADDRSAHGLNGKTYGRVTLYCCAHDQVVSAATVAGMGWRGMSDKERADTNADGVFTQRVFSSGFEVGTTGVYYHYWRDDWRKTKNEKEGFWFPPSPPARFALGRALRANTNPIAQFFTLATAPALYLFNVFTNIPVNAIPDKDWQIYINAPALKKTFQPQAMRYGAPANVKDGDLTSQFNEGFDPPADARNKNKGEDGTPLDPNDPYDAWSGKGQGDVQSEAGQRYEDHATLRMLARRTHNRDWVDRNGKVRGEDDPANASIDYQVWRKGQIDEILANGLNNNATNHSTIMTNADHAEKALAYDVAIGLCYLSDRELKKIRLAADWRFVDGLDADDPGYPYIDYFQSGSMNDKSIASWVRSDRDANMPARIVDIRDGIV